MPYADLSQATLFYADDRSGTATALFVHGWGCDSTDWSWQIGPFAKAGMRVIAVDNRGHGCSSVPGEGYDPPGLAADLAELILRLDVAPVVAIGHSLGGYIVATLAVEHPDLVAAMVGVDPGYGRGDKTTENTVERLLKTIPEPGGLELAASAFAAMEGPDTPVVLQAWHRRRLLACDPRALVGALEGLYRHPSAIGTREKADLYLRRRQCPTLVIHTDAERATWEATTFRHPASRSLTWPGTGHWLHQERPEEFNVTVLNWIAELHLGDPLTKAS